MKRWAVLGVAAGAGYLAGSVSFSRLIGAWRAPGEDLTATEFQWEEKNRTVTLRGITPMVITEHLGARWGVLAVALEAAKAAVPTAIARAAAPGTHAAEAAAWAAVAGHAFPLGRGSEEAGFGESPMLGGFLVLDPLGFAVTTGLSSAVIGATGNRRLIMAWPATIVAWAALRRDRGLLLYAVGANVVMWSRLVRALGMDVAPAFMVRSRPDAEDSAPPPS
jgi:glycerol-3-phosphate acyltransferase PlsY